MRAKFVFEKFTEVSDPIQDMGIGMRGVIKKFLSKVGEHYKNDDEAFQLCVQYGNLKFADYLMEYGDFKDFLLERLKTYIEKLPSKLTDIFKSDRYKALTPEEKDKLWLFCGGKIEQIQRGANKGKNKYLYRNNTIDKNEICLKKFGLPYNLYDQNHGKKSFLGLKFESFSMIYTVLTDNGKPTIATKTYNNNRTEEENVAYGLEWVRAFNEFDLNEYKGLHEDLFNILKEDYKKLKNIVDKWISIMKKAGYKIPVNLKDYDYNKYYLKEKTAKQMGFK